MRIHLGLKNLEDSATRSASPGMEHLAMAANGQQLSRMSGILAIKDEGGDGPL